MTDLEITKLCAKAMDYVTMPCGEWIVAEIPGIVFPQFYWPLNDDAQAMALVKRFELCIQPPELDGSGRWHVWSLIDKRASRDKDINRAICECVAKKFAEVR